MTFAKLPETEQFRHVLKTAKIYHGNNLPTIDYVGTVKLHGTSGRVSINGGKLTIGSREQVLEDGRDNNGFAAFCNSVGYETFEKIAAKITNNKNITIYGEWCGKGINAGCAIHQLEKFFVIFGIRENLDDEETQRWIEFSHVDLSEFNSKRIYSSYQFPTYNYTIDFNAPEAELNKIIEQTLLIEQECPVGKFFGVSGIGEGLVLRPINPEYYSYRYVFKSKGEKHSKSHVKTLPKIDVEKVNSAKEFAAKHVNNERLTQGIEWLKSNNKEISEKLTGDYIKWVISDIMKEQHDELEANGLTVKDVSGHISKISKDYLFSLL